MSRRELIDIFVKNNMHKQASKFGVNDRLVYAVVWIPIPGNGVKAKEKCNRGNIEKMMNKKQEYKLVTSSLLQSPLPTRFSFI